MKSFVILHVLRGHGFFSSKPLPATRTRHIYRPPLQQPASLYCQSIQRHLQLRDDRADFRMLSNLLLQRLQHLLSTCNMRLCLAWILLGTPFDRCSHGRSPPGFLSSLQQLPHSTHSTRNSYGLKYGSFAMRMNAASEPGDELMRQSASLLMSNHTRHLMSGKLVRRVGMISSIHLPLSPPT